MDVREAIRTKRAVRRFTTERLPQEAIEHILNAGRRAQSAKNSQPWDFVAIQERATLEKLAATATNAPHLAQAALAVAIITPHPDQRWSIMFDAGQAAAYMQLAAWELGIGSCLATIYEPDDARRLLGFPADLHARAAISFGYPMDPAVLSNEPVAGGRRSSDEVIHHERWQR